jgi:low affinity Fe/Cu permease
MIFLIEYDRAAGKLVRMQTFTNSQRGAALEARLAREIALQNQTKKHEVVVLEAASEEDLRATHRRYFEDVGSLSRAAG